MKAWLKQYGSKLNIEHIGIAPAKTYKQLEKILYARSKAVYYKMFDEQKIKTMTQPQLTLSDAKSVIVCLFPYFTGHNDQANISKYTYGLDYHQVIKEKLTQLGEFLQIHINDFQYQAFTDTGPLVDRYVAYLAGLGYRGINTHMITDYYGSYFFIGYMICNYPFELDLPLEKTCVRCGKCIEACPGNAILGDFSINSLKCLSYITQKRKMLLEEEIVLLKKHHLVYGCDICQDVCPHNQNVPITHIQAFRENLLYRLDHEKICGMSNKEFKRMYGDRAFSWVGKKVICRNFEVMQ